MSKRLRAAVLRAITVLSVALAALAITGPAASAHGGGPPRSADFDAGWRFALVNKTAATDPTGAYAHAADPGYDDSAWRAVTLPHDWSIELDPTPEGGTTSGTGFFQGGLGWYRKSFTLPRSAARKQLSVEFDGVYMDSSVYFNGRLVATHPYGYTGFAVDLSRRAHTDAHTPNVLAVEVRNQLPSSRWYSGSGIYRNVHLITTAPVHVARHGVFVTTPGLASTSKQDYADVRVQTQVAAPGSAPVTVVAKVRDADGDVVGARRARVTPADGEATDTSTIRVGHPDLWAPGHPALYTLQTELRAHGRVLDRTNTTFGMRWFSASSTSTAP